MEENTHKVVIVWDLIKDNLKKSEEDEFIRLIGPELIEKNEELRAEVENYMDIANDLRAGMEEQSAETEPVQQPAKIFLNKNNEFLEKEISFFITNLRTKAQQNGLDEEILIPLKDKRDLQIYSYVQNKEKGNERPSTASTRYSSKYGENPDQGPDSMNSTFTEGFKKDKKLIPELPKNKCVLDFGKSEIEILKEIAEIINKETVELEDEIKVQQDLIMNPHKPKPVPEVIEEPTPKELYEFKSRLEESYLKSGKDSKANNIDPAFQPKAFKGLPSLKPGNKLKIPLKIVKKTSQEPSSEFEKIK